MSREFDVFVVGCLPHGTYRGHLWTLCRKHLELMQCSLQLVRQTFIAGVPKLVEEWLVETNELC